MWGEPIKRLTQFIRCALFQVKNASQIAHIFRLCCLHRQTMSFSHLRFCMNLNCLFVNWRSFHSFMAYYFLFCALHTGRKSARITCNWSRKLHHNKPKPTIHASPWIFIRFESLACTDSYYNYFNKSYKHFNDWTRTTSFRFYIHQQKCSMAVCQCEKLLWFWRLNRTSACVIRNKKIFSFISGHKYLDRYCVFSGYIFTIFWIWNYWNGPVPAHLQLN